MKVNQGISEIRHVRGLSRDSQRRGGGRNHSRGELTVADIAHIRGVIEDITKVVDLTNGYRRRTRRVVKGERVSEGIARLEASLACEGIAGGQRVSCRIARGLAQIEFRFVRRVGVCAGDVAALGHRYGSRGDCLRCLILGDSG